MKRHKPALRREGHSEREKNPVRSQMPQAPAIQITSPEPSLPATPSQVPGTKTKLSFTPDQIDHWLNGSEQHNIRIQ